MEDTACKGLRLEGDAIDSVDRLLLLRDEVFESLQAQQKSANCDGSRLCSKYVLAHQFLQVSDLLLEISLPLGPSCRLLGYLDCMGPRIQLASNYRWHRASPFALSCAYFLTLLSSSCVSGPTCCAAVPVTLAMAALHWGRAVCYTLRKKSQTIARKERGDLAHGKEIFSTCSPSRGSRDFTRRRGRRSR